MIREVTEIFLIAMVVSLLFTPPIIRLAVKLGVVDKPGPRRVNVRIMPRMGGPAIMLGFIVATFFFQDKIDAWPGIAAGALIVFTVGVIDDARSLRAGIKLLGHVAAAIIAFRSGVRIEFITNPSGGMIHIPYMISFFITVFWIIGITNAINLIDGLDGLAAGIVCIAAMTFMLVAIQKGQLPSALMSAALAGSAAGFLRWNFYPAKTFMGDAGAYFMGYTAAVIAVMGAFKSTTALTLLVPVLALGVPIFDTSFAIIRRYNRGLPIMTAADKGHLHHRMLAIGLNHRTSVMVCYGITLLLSAASLALAGAWRLSVALVLCVGSLVIILITAGKLVKRKPAGRKRALPDEPPPMPIPPAKRPGPGEKID